MALTEQLGILLPAKRDQAPLVVRSVLLAIVITLTFLNPVDAHVIAWLVSLAVAATLATVLPTEGRTGLVVEVVESVIVIAGVLDTGADASPFLPYLVAPAFGGGLSRSIEAAATPAVLALFAFAAARPLLARASPIATYTITFAEWCLLSLGAGLIGSWVRRLREAHDSRSQEQQPYLAAYRLLSQLRTVARQLSGGLDAVTLGSGLLGAISEHVSYQRGAVYVRSRGERLVPLAFTGAERVPWDADISGDSPFADAWVAHQPQIRSVRLGAPGEPGSSLVIPLRIGLRGFGLVALDTAEAGVYTRAAVRELEPVVSEAALRLETALLFDEIREVATAEERRRLAREIHDGIAQELASLGYLVDSLTSSARSTGSELEQPMRGIRAEITRLIGEVRMSIFELRSEVEQHGGLGAALSEFVRSVGQTSPFTVHLTLDETTTRLPAEVEAELLRIAQEAITNARKHAGARNLWVHCIVDPPRALLRVEDDGVGLGEAREDSFGIEIMKERASRLRARLRVDPRDPEGTIVEVVLVGIPRAGNRLVSTRSARE